jgi:hypothetical protein
MLAGEMALLSSGKLHITTPEKEKVHTHLERLAYKPMTKIRDNRDAAACAKTRDQSKS